ncbi:MAG: hypothetical protein V3V68_04945 [Nitrosomonadaceae bacterium]
MNDNKFVRTQEGDPNCCQATTPKGQCFLKAVPGGKYCLVHGGGAELKTQERRDLKNYRLAKFRVRAAELGNSDHLTSLTDEVGILRMLIEEMINNCGDQSELLLRAGPLADLIMKSEKLVSSCHRLDSRLGNLLSKDQIMQFAQLVVEIISKEIDDEQVLDTISANILKIYGEIT